MPSIQEEINPDERYYPGKLKSVKDLEIYKPFEKDECQLLMNKIYDENTSFYLAEANGIVIIKE